VLAHASAFADPAAIEAIRCKCPSLHLFIADENSLSLSDAVSSYIFNSQIVTLPDGTMSIIAPVECQNHAGVQRYLAAIFAGDSPIKSIQYVDLRQSMNNGGGPACLRLRVVVPAELCKRYVLTSEKIDQLENVIKLRYRDALSLADLADPLLIAESSQTVEAIYRVLGLS
jgi:succinylarginine dihydrolase